MSTQSICAQSKNLSFRLEVILSLPPSINPRVLVFDSGVGGLSVARAISNRLPVNIIYATDNAAFPYGNKNEDVLIERSVAVIGEVMRQKTADIIVIACNTASTVVLPKLRELFDRPIIGVVPAIKPAAQISQTKVIGLLATPGTVQRQYTQDLIQTFAKDCQIIPKGTTELVKIAEDKLHGKEINATDIRSIVDKFSQEKEMDTVILACTHFPLLVEELKTVLPHIRFWVDSGEAIARRVEYWLEELKLNDSVLKETKHHCFVTKQSSKINTLEKTLQREHFDKVESLVLPYDA